MFEWLFKLFSFMEPAPADSEQRLLGAAIEAVVDGTDPRLRAVPHYQEHLREATQNTLRHVRHMAGQLGEPVALTRANFAADARVHLLFSRADAITDLLRTSPELRQLKADQPFASEYYGVLTAKREEKHVLGMKMMGEVLQNDVPQTVLNFKEHRLLALSSSPTDSLIQIKRSAFTYVVQRALAAVTALKNHNGDLAAHLLQERFVALAQYHGNLEPGVLPKLPTPVDCATQDRISALDERLQACLAAPCSLDDYLRVVVEAIAHPERCLQQGHYSPRVDRMGVVLGAAEAEQVGAESVLLPEVLMPDYPNPIVTLPVRISGADIPDYQGLRTDVLL